MRAELFYSEEKLQCPRAFLSSLTYQSPERRCFPRMRLGPTGPSWKTSDPNQWFSRVKVRIIFKGSHYVIH